MTNDLKIIVEEHADGFVAYPVGLRGVIVGQRDTLDEAVADVTSANQVSRGDVRRLEMDQPLLHVFVTEARVAV